MAATLILMDRGTETPATPPTRVAVFEILRGTLEIISPDGISKTLSEEDLPITVNAGSRLRTDGSSRAGVRLEGGQSLRLDVDTSIQLASTELARLEDGRIYIDSEVHGDASIEIATPFGTAREIGTQFEVRLTDSSLSVAVREGAVSVSNEDLDLEIQHGVAATITSAGLVDRSRIDATASHWDWVQEIAPPFDIEGRSVASFLAWVSRETGVQIQYSSSELEAFAHETLLHGTAQGLTPTQAPEVILASCGLTAVEDAGSLIVQRNDSRPGGH